MPHPSRDEQTILGCTRMGSTKIGRIRLFTSKGIHALSEYSTFRSTVLTARLSVNGNMQRHIATFRGAVPYNFS